MLARKCDSAMDAKARAERGALSKEQAPWLDCNFFCVTQTNHQQRRKRTLEVAGKMALDGSECLGNGDFPKGKNEKSSMASV